MSSLEWQAFGSTGTAHLIDADRPAPKRSGPRSLCKRYPGRNEYPWFTLDASIVTGELPYALSKCPDCASSMPEVKP